MRNVPLRNALATCVLLIVAGLVSIILGERVVARTLNVYDQIPAMVSGGVGGLALVITGCVFALVQVGRACAEWERADEAAVLDEVEVLIDAEHEPVAAHRHDADQPNVDHPNADQVSDMELTGPLQAVTAP